MAVLPLLFAIAELNVGALAYHELLHVHGFLSSARLCLA